MLTIEQIEEGIAWSDTHVDFQGNPTPILLPEEIRVRAVRFRKTYNDLVIRSMPNEYMWVHDAVHDWLGAPPTEDGEARVRSCMRPLGIKTCQDFLDLTVCYQPSDFLVGAD